MANIWDAAKQYFRDAMPGGALNPEVSRQGILDTAAISLTPVPIVGDIAGLLADANRYATDPSSRTPGNFALSGLGLLPFVPGVTMWHGGPHKLPPEPGFPAGRLRLDKIGTGEGAQAYGHGIYGAEEKGVAQGYARTLGKREFNLQDKVIYPTSGGATNTLDKQTAAERIAADALDHAMDSQSTSPAQFAANHLRQQVKYYPEMKADVEAAMNVIANWQAAGGKASDIGNLYKFDLPDSVLPRLLDWDAPLSQQTPEVQSILRKQGISGKTWQVGAVGDGPQGYMNDRFVFDNAKEARQWLNQLRGEGYTARPYRGSGPLQETTGQSFYRDLGAETEAAAKLRALGIPGLRYLDGNSRGAGQGSRNYVIWDQGLLDQMPPLEINGVPTGLLK